MAEGPDEGVGEPGVSPLCLACQAFELKDLIKEGGNPAQGSHCHTRQIKHGSSHPQTRCTQTCRQPGQSSRSRQSASGQEARHTRAQDTRCSASHTGLSGRTGSACQKGGSQKLIHPLE